MTFEKGSHLFNVDDVCKYMFIITEGMVEIVTLMDNGVELIIERLMPGSSINVIARC
jgi:CRP-like cAMP-binding protein